MPLAAVLVLALGTYLFRVAGPLLRSRWRPSARLERLLSIAAVVLLVALTATSTFTQGPAFAGWARPLGVLMAGVLALRKAPFPVIVLAAAVTTAVARLAGLT